MTIEEVLSFEEMQIFDRKSINIEPKALAIPLVAFANADGGTIAVGISDKTRRIEGVDFEVQKYNELLRVPFDFCNPTIPVQIEKVPCVDYQGRKNHVLLIHIEPSPQVHTNQADEAYLRVGDKSKLLKFDERLQLTYDKGERYKNYIDKIGYSKTPLEYLKQNKGFIKEKDGCIQVSTAAILLFGRNPQNFFPRARIRFIKYEGTQEKFGTEMNVIKDVIFKGTILDMINNSIKYLDTQVKEKTYLGANGKFVTEEEYPKFVRQELIVNAVTHRAYSISGTDIQIKMFDNRIVVESPGKLPGLVKTDNMRYTHFSRNPKIAEFLKAYNFVKEYGEGVNRMCIELETVGLKEPEYYTNAFMLQATIYNGNKNSSGGNVAIDTEDVAIDTEDVAIDTEDVAIGNQKVTLKNLKLRLDEQNYLEATKQNILSIYDEMETNQIFGTKEISDILHFSSSGARRVLNKIIDTGVVTSVKGKGKGRYRFLNNEEIK